MLVKILITNFRIFVLQNRLTICIFTCPIFEARVQSTFPAKFRLPACAK